MEDLERICHNLNDFMDMLNNEIKLPDGYIFKDENGNIIDTSKIVLEKKEKEYPKTYKEKEYPKTYEECCKILYEECCKILGVDPDNFLTITNCYDGEVETTDYERGLLSKFASLWYLRICRDAYWKLAGEKMGLGKPWGTGDCKIVYGICREKGNIVKRDDYFGGTHTFEFPIREMRDAFYENFKELIEICKELM